MASIAAGESLVALFYFDVIRLRGLQPVVPAVVAAAIVFVVVSLLVPSAAGRPALVGPIPRRKLWRIVPFAALFILANDFWAWGKAPIVLLGIPLWTWYSIVLGLRPRGGLRGLPALLARRGAGRQRRPSSIMARKFPGFTAEVIVLPDERT